MNLESPGEEARVLISQSVRLVKLSSGQHPAFVARWNMAVVRT
jgi:hypothetical protein